MRYRFQSAGKTYTIILERHGQGYRAIVDGLSYELEVLDDQPGALSLRFEGRPLTVYWAVDGGSKWAALDGCTYLLEKPTASLRRAAGERPGEAVLRAPMPAQVRSVEVTQGEHVTQGQTLLLLEAMKMEIRLQAPHAGQVARLLVRPGQQVDRDQTLVELSEID